MENTIWRALACAGALALVSPMALAQEQVAAEGAAATAEVAVPVPGAASGTAEMGRAEAPPPSAAGPVELEPGAGFDCVEVMRFETDTGFIADKKAARAAGIPQDKLDEIQRRVAGSIPETIPGLKATLGGAGSYCPDPGRTIVLDGRIVDFKKGNQALRYFVGFGAGAQKFSVAARATRKSDGALIGEGEVTDRKVGGWLGGQADKGISDFAEKVADFLGDSLKRKR